MHAVTFPRLNAAMPQRFGLCTKDRAEARAHDPHPFFFVRNNTIYYLVNGEHDQDKTTYQHLFLVALEGKEDENAKLDAFQRQLAWQVDKKEPS